MPEILSFPASQGALLIFLITLAARLGAPLPAAPFLIVAGGLTASGQASWPGVAGAALLGNIIGDAAWFLAGRHWGYRVMQLLCRISLSPDSCVRRSESIIGRWGGMSLIAAKFVPGVSVVAAPMAGALGMSNLRFLAYETVAALVWTLGFMLLGRIFHSAIADVLELMSEIGLAALLVCVLALAAFVAWRWRQRRLARRTDDIAHIEVQALREALAAGGITVIDVRSDDARAIDPRAIPGAIGIGLKQLPRRLEDKADWHDVVLFCDCPDDASAIAGARVLMAAGLPRVRVLAGGLDAWAASGSAATPGAAAEAPMLQAAGPA